MSSAICFNLDQSKILSSGNGLKPGLHREKFQRAFDIRTGTFEKRPVNTSKIVDPFQPVQFEPADMANGYIFCML